MSFLKRALVVLCVACACVAFAQADEFAGDEYYNQGLDLVVAGKYREAIPYLTKAIELDARNADALSERAGAWVELGEYDKAIADANQSLKFKPSDPITFNGRGRAWLSKGEFDKALADFNYAIRFDDTADAAYFINRGLAWQGKGDLDKAIADFNKGIETDRTNDHTYYIDRARAWNAKGDFEKTLRDFKEAARIAPRDAEAANALAWLQATCPDAKVRDGKAAFENASQAYQLSGGKDWGYLDTLAAAYAESGAFDLAREWQAKAIDLAPAESKDMLKARLELYKQDKAYREEITAPPSSAAGASDAPPTPPPAP